MNQKLSLSMTGIILSLAMLMGCGKPSSETMPQETKPAEANPTHLEETIADNHLVDADVYAPEFPISRTHVLHPLSLAPEEALRIITADETAACNVADNGYGGLKGTTDSGESITVDAGFISYGYLDGERLGRYGEMENLIQLYYAEQPTENNSVLDFMSMEDAISKAETMLKKMGIPYDAEVQFCGGLTHDQMMNYQQELLEKDKTLPYPEYDCFGNIPVLTDLTDADDAYYIKFGFRYDDLPVYGFDPEPNVGTVDGVTTPFGAYAEILMTRNGVAGFTSMGVYQITQSSNGDPLLTAMDALELYKSYWSERLRPMDEEYWRVNAIYLEYVPRYVDDALILTPYWCVCQKDQYTNSLSGLKEWSPWPSGMRFNAQTGGDLAYGG